MKNLIHIAVLATIVLLSSCHQHSETDCHDHGAEATEGEHHDEHENTNTATLTNEQIKSIGIEYGGMEK